RIASPTSTPPLSTAALPPAAGRRGPHALQDAPGTALAEGIADQLQIEVVAAAVAGDGTDRAEGVGLDDVLLVWVVAEDQAAGPGALEDVVQHRVEQGGGIRAPLAGDGIDLEEVGDLVEVAAGVGQVAEGAAAHEAVVAHTVVQLGH